MRLITSVLSMAIITTIVAQVSQGVQAKGRSAAGERT